MKSDSSDTSYWLWGLAFAVIGAVANSVTVYIVNPAEFNLGAQWSGLAAYALLSGLVAAGMYMQDPSPAPVQGTVNWGKWVKGLVAAVIGGATNTVSMILLASRDAEGFAADWETLLPIALVALVTSGAAYLKVHPIPVTPDS